MDPLSTTTIGDSEFVIIPRPFQIMRPEAITEAKLLLEETKQFDHTGFYSGKKSNTKRYERLVEAEKLEKAAINYINKANPFFYDFSALSNDDRRKLIANSIIKDKITEIENSDETKFETNKNEYVGAITFLKKQYKENDAQKVLSGLSVFRLMLNTEISENDIKDIEKKIAYAIEQKDKLKDKEVLVTELTALKLDFNQVKQEKTQLEAKLLNEQQKFNKSDAENIAYVKEISDLKTLNQQIELKSKFYENQVIVRDANMIRLDQDIKQLKNELKLEKKKQKVQQKQDQLLLLLLQQWTKLNSKRNWTY